MVHSIIIIVYSVYSNGTALPIMSLTTYFIYLCVFLTIRIHIDTKNSATSTINVVMNVIIHSYRHRKRELTSKRNALKLTN